MPARKDFSVWRGNDLKIPFIFTNEGAPADLSSSQFRITIGWTSPACRTSRRIDKTTADNLESFVLDVAGGKATLHLTPEETMELPPYPSIVRYELEVLADGLQTTILEGIFNIGGGLNAA